MLLCLDSHRHKDPVEVIVNQFATDYLVKIIQEERLEEARQARVRDRIRGCPEPLVLEDAGQRGHSQAGVDGSSWWSPGGFAP